MTELSNVTVYGFISFLSDYIDRNSASSRKEMLEYDDSAPSGLRVQKGVLGAKLVGRFGRTFSGSRTRVAVVFERVLIRAVQRANFSQVRKLKQLAVSVLEVSLVEKTHRKCEEIVFRMTMHGGAGA